MRVIVYHTLGVRHQCTGGAPIPGGGIRRVGGGELAGKVLVDGSGVGDKSGRKGRDDTHPPRGTPITLGGRGGGSQGTPKNIGFMAGHRSGRAGIGCETLPPPPLARSMGDVRLGVGSA